MTFLLLFSTLFSTNFLTHVLAQSSSPWAVPLTVRSPYLNTWLSGPDSPQTTWPNFYNMGRVTGWQVYAQVDNTTWSIMGAASSNQNISSFTNLVLTPTQTIYTMQAGPMSVNLTFLSPIEPADMVKQSFPFSYITLSVSSTDGQSHNVNLYSDISGEILSVDQTLDMQWDTTQTSQTIHHSLELSPTLSFTEADGIIEDGAAYFATTIQSGMTWQSGQDIVVRGQFIDSGKLANTQNNTFRAIQNDWPVFGLSLALGTISSSSAPMVFALGKTRDPAVQYTGSSGIQQRSLYYQSKYNQNISGAIDDFLSDYHNAQSRADAFDNQLMSNASNISLQYAQLVALAARQTMGATEITIAKGADGNWNTSDVLMFMREMGSETSVTPVDILYASFPAFLYINASYAGYLLEPLLQYQTSSAYTNDYAAANLGPAYPNATGNPLAHPQGVEQTGNMLIMVLAHARATGNGQLLSTYYNLLQGWANYLTTNALYPSGQTTADGISTANITNLAIKGIIGMQAMSEISQAVGRTDDAATYAKNASAAVQAWSTAASTSDHLESVYGSVSSNGLMYNLYADKLLQTNLVSSQIYSVQTSFYNNDPSSAYGLPYDSSNNTEAKSHWTAFTAATASQSNVRDKLLSFVYARASANGTGISGSNPTTYRTDNGALIDGASSAAQGAMFSLLALTMKNQTINASPVSNGVKSSSGSDVGAIAGGVVGGIIAILAIAIICLFVMRRRRAARNGEVKPTAPVDKTTPSRIDPIPYAWTPYTDNPSGQSSQPLLGETYDAAAVIRPPTSDGTYPPAQQPQSYYNPTASNPPNLTPYGYPRDVKGPKPPVARHTTNPSESSSQSQSYTGTEISSRSSDTNSSSGRDDSRQLRSELEQLRREVLSIREMQHDVPPPEYHSGE